MSDYRKPEIVELLRPLGCSLPLVENRKRSFGGFWSGKLLDYLRGCRG